MQQGWEARFAPNFNYTGYELNWTETSHLAYRLIQEEAILHAVASHLIRIPGLEARAFGESRHPIGRSGMSRALPVYERCATVGTPSNSCSWKTPQAYWQATALCECSPTCSNTEIIYLIKSTYQVYLVDFTRWCTQVDFLISVSRHGDIKSKSSIANSGSRK